MPLVVALEALAVVVAVVVALVEAVVAVVAALAAALVVEVALEALAASNQNVSRNQEFVSFCKNNSGFACRYAIKVISLQAKSE